MKLLNVYTWEIQDFTSDDKIPPYAILSHTWSGGEVTFRDWHEVASTEIEKKEGFKKIRYCCSQSMRDGLEWVWIDSCCIDKSSSAELSEAINSMYRWYQKSEVCYVYLVDVSIHDRDVHESMSRARWYGRGWTLQELLAPGNLMFYSKEWQPLGSKLSLQDTIVSITGIDKTFLEGRELQYASVSKRMSWAANRTTARIEDIAYCLFGIFDVNMPLIYGEGKKAFLRLQHEIMKSYPYDHTLFAWGTVAKTVSLDISKNKVLPAWDPDKAGTRLRGLFADSPKDFEFTGSFEPSPYALDFYDEPMVQAKFPIPLGRGVQFEAVVSTSSSVYYWDQVATSQLRVMWYAILLCRSRGKSNEYLAVPLQPSNASIWGRTREIITQSFTYSPHKFASRIRRMHVEAERPFLLADGDLIARRMDYPYAVTESPRPLIGANAEWAHGVNVLSRTSAGELVCFTYNFKETERKGTGFGVIIGRLPGVEGKLGKLRFCVAPTGSKERDKSDSRPFFTDDYLWKEWSVDNFIAEQIPPEYVHLVEDSPDKWVMEEIPGICITLKAERLAIEDNEANGMVDVFELLVTKRKEELELAREPDTKV